MKNGDKVKFELTKYLTLDGVIVKVHANGHLDVKTATATYSEVHPGFVKGA